MASVSLRHIYPIRIAVFDISKEARGLGGNRRAVMPTAVDTVIEEAPQQLSDG